MPANVDENKIYQNLIKRFPLRPIRNDEQNDRAAEICDSLTDRLGIPKSSGERLSRGAIGSDCEVRI